jgi:pimeloyl-ACP methyl ester carboxylesterase
MLLVIHGTADPVFPVEHGIALCEGCSGARLLKLKGGGHELHPGHWDRIVEAIGEPTKSGSRPTGESGRTSRP